MHRFCVFGNPIKHSLSPLMHNFAFKNLQDRLGFLGCYEAVLLEDGKLLREKFLESGFRGANITVPFKEQAFFQCDEVCGIAKEIGAVNTWVLDSNKIFGYNTDAEGFYKTIENLGFKNVLILGAGGSARGVAYILRQKGLRVVLLNRSAKRLEDFKDFECSTFDDFKKSYDFDLVVNSTSASIDDSLPCSRERLEKLLENTKMAYDLFYGRQTSFLDFALKLGCQVKDGLEMLIYQGALAFLLFNDLDKGDKKGIDFLKVASLMRSALEWKMS